MRRGQVIVALTLAAMLAGCVQADGAYFLEPHSFEGVGAFTHVPIRLAGPVRILDRDDSLRDAYIASIASLATPGKMEQIFLDGWFHQVRVDSNCPVLSQGCVRYASVDYSQRGIVPRYGIGWPVMLANDPNDYGRRTPTPVVATWLPPDGHVRTVEIQATANLPSYAPGLHRFQSGQFLFTDENIAPDTYKRGEPLDPIRPWNHGSIPRNVLPSDEVFEDSASDFLGMGANIDEMTRRLGQAEPEAKHAFDQGCLATISVVMSEHATGEPVGGQARTTAHLEFATLPPSAWKVTVTKDLLGRPIFEFAKDEVVNRPASCEDIRAAPAASASAAAAYAQAREASSGHQELMRFTFSRSPGAPYIDRPPEAGWSQYRFQFMPKWFDESQGGLLIPYLVVVDAATGWFEYLLLSPEDKATFDRH